MRVRYLVFPFVPVVLLLVVLLLHKSHRARMEHGVVFSPAQVKILKAWASLEYTPIDHTPAFRDAVCSLHIADDSRYPDERPARALPITILDFLYAYHDGTWEAFSRFAIPITNITVSPERLRSRFDVLQNLKKLLKLQNTLAISENDAISILRGFWELCNGPYDRSVLGDDADYFRTDFLEAVAFERSAAHVKVSTAQPSLYSHAMIPEESIGFFHEKHSVIFEPSVSSLTAQEGLVRFAVVKLQVKTKSDPPMPVFISYYWVPGYEKWLPLELGIPYSPRRRHGFLM